jgi:hypothetical protein
MDGAHLFMTNHAAPCAQIKKHYGFAIQKNNVLIPTNILLHATISTYFTAPNKHYLAKRRLLFA